MFELLAQAVAHMKLMLFDRHRNAGRDPSQTSAGAADARTTGAPERPRRRPK
jgi:hypothetical protein